MNSYYFSGFAETVPAQPPTNLPEAAAAEMYGQCFNPSTHPASVILSPGEYVSGVHLL
jgi:hypothetical protein